MQPTEMAGAEAPVESPSFEDTVLALLGQMSDQIKSLGERVEAVEAQPEMPRFIDPRDRVNGASYDRSQEALTASPDRRGAAVPRSQTIPQFPNGQRVPDLVMNMFRPKFGTGDWVTYDPEAVPEGRDDGRTRGSLMGEKGVPNGIGQVLDRTFLSEQQSKGWKYRVKFPREVTPGCVRGVVHVYERELLPA